jgi:tRNA U34 5-methylaminomethyl-2-thiouridine-forming methyltransferase MnmC
MSLNIINTSDGSHTLYNEKLNETYHSIHGAIQESEHIYIESGIKYFINTQKKKNIRILEVGFGTGLNALLTCLNSTSIINYIGLEAFPLQNKNL